MGGGGIKRGMKRIAVVFGILVFTVVFLITCNIESLIIDVIKDKIATDLGGGTQ